MNRIVRRVGITLLLAIGVLFVWAINNPPEPELPDPAAYRPSAQDAERMCREHVTNQLKAPSTAKFGDIRTRGFGSEYTVTGWVDAENSFGATLRTRWECTAIHTGGGTWRTASHVR